MKNITITLPEETANWVRVWAARQNLSVSAALAALLEDIRQNKDLRLSAAKVFFNVPARNLSSGMSYPERETLYER